MVPRASLPKPPNDADGKIRQKFMSIVPVRHKKAGKEHLSILHGGTSFGIYVETADQSEFLRALNCDEVQGYFLAPPVPADAFVELIRGRLLGDPSAACNLSEAA